MSLRQESRSAGAQSRGRSSPTRGQTCVRGEEPLKAERPMGAAPQRARYWRGHSRNANESRRHDGTPRAAAAKILTSAGVEPSGRSLQVACAGHGRPTTALGCTRKPVANSPAPATAPMSPATPRGRKEAQDPDALQGSRWGRESGSVALGETAWGHTHTGHRSQNRT